MTDPDGNDPANADNIGGLPKWFVGTIIALGIVFFLLAVICIVLVVLRRKHRIAAQRFADELDSNQTAWSSIDNQVTTSLMDDSEDSFLSSGQDRNDMGDLVGGGSRKLGHVQGRSIHDEDE